MLAHNYRRLPVSACSLSPPPQLFSTTALNIPAPVHKYRRVWMEALKYLSPAEILGLSSTCRLFYTLAYEPELWHDVCLRQVPDYIFAAIESEVYLSVSPVFHLPYSEMEEIVRDNLPSNSDAVSEADEVTLMNELEKTVPDPYKVNEIDLSKVKPQEYRKIALVAFSLECLSCRSLKHDVVRCPVLGRYLCIECRSLPKYRMLSLHGVTKKYGVSKEQLDELSIPFVKAPNPRSKNFHDMLLYYDFTVKLTLDLHQVPQYLRYKELKRTLVAQGYNEALNLLYGKVFTKYIKDQGVTLEGIIRNLAARLNRSKTKVAPKQGRKPPRQRDCSK
eukprot:CAMPEP_0204917178 /NCGR_PEP_ID=MMETSP1397-20131031/14840_1 /ASSEMBLY_ACC=CAM_ASM_000891 /TAXON_ID=49980 /ORGANISM="Climacostomum Climacostomum virens, Strain Stock W-24" /LENGTH=332 /DNA_ID=CAMNT_0052089957 /DNA_START=126 /DNA_END=1121 /DNA_ORIENTATION=+